MRKILLNLLIVPVFLVACSSDRGDDSAGVAESSDTGSVEAQAAEAEKLNTLVDVYFDRILELNPVYATFVGENRYNDRFSNSIGEEWIAESEALEEEYLAKVNEINPDLLQGQDLLTYEIFKRNRENSIAGFKFPGELLPVSQFFSTPNFFAQMGSGASVQPFQTAEDYDNFLGRVDGFLVWMDQAIANMRKGVEAGYVQPRVLMERTLPQLQAHVVENVQDSVFYSPVKNMPEDFSEEDRARLTAAYEDAIQNKLVPAYAKLHDYIRDEYLPETRDVVGMHALPGGEEWYAYNVAQTTTTALTPEDIHQIGLNEVARIHNEMRGVMEEVGFDGTLDEFFDDMNDEPQFYYDEPDQLVQGYSDMKDRINALTPKLFEIFPKADYEVRKVEAFREKSAAGASYMAAAPDGSRPGIFYVNTYDIKARPKWAMESLSLHEAAPGHHFQISIQRELEGLPRFRRFGGYTAYIEGWGLYAESIGKELGVYTDPYQYFGALNAELWRAIRLVVDTGLHYKGWSREDVLDYMYENSAVKEARAVSEAERYIAIPSQALAYTVGQLKIREIRDNAEAALGDRFDVRKFHTQILEDGALPLNVLEAKIDRWVASQL